MAGGGGSDLLGPLFGTPETIAIFADSGRLQGMLDFEAALARVQAKLGIVPKSVGEAVTAAADAAFYDMAALGRAAARAGNPAIPMVKALTAKVADTDAEAARFVHWGATSQDAMDTGLVLQLRRFLDHLEPDLDRLIEALAALAEAEAGTVLAGRTWLQQALPVTFGLKAAGWLDALLRHRERLVAVRRDLLVVQLGGAAGTLASLGERGIDVAEALACELGLAAPATPWHTARDRVVGLGCFLGLLVGTLGKIARDVSLLMQTEVGEAFEPAGEGRGGSSTMPHKRNPVGAAVILSAATRAPALVATLLAGMPQEQERGLGGWQAEWETLPALAILAGGALGWTVEIVSGLELDRERMGANLGLTRGLVMAEAVQMALGERIGRQEAHTLLEGVAKAASAKGLTLREAILAEPAIMAELSPEAVDRLVDPANYLGSTHGFVQRVLAARTRA